MAHCCFKQGCELEVQYSCLCLSSVAYCCEFHLQEHLKLPNRAHTFDSVLTELSKGTRDATLRFLKKEKTKKEKLKKIGLASINQNRNNHRNSIEEGLKALDSDLKEISCLIKKISQLSDKEEGPHLNQLILQPDTNTEIEMLPNDPEPYSSAIQFYLSAQLKNKKLEMLNRVNNDLKTEQDFRRTCSLYKNHDFDSLLSQAYQEYISAYKKLSSLYLINIDKIADMYIYDTENETEKFKVLVIPKELTNAYEIITTELPNGELLFTGKLRCKSHIPFIVDRNYRFQKLPSPGLLRKLSTAIYFNRSIYFFGWMSSCKFDFDSNRWSCFAKTDKIYRFDNKSIIFNGNILISEYLKCELLLYSIDIDSFSDIPYKFSKYAHKILINIEERLYLIECGCGGLIYESEIGDEYTWAQIARSKIWNNKLYRASCSYNKGGIYISMLFECGFREYFKFDLDQKALIEIAFYSEQLALKSSGNKLEVIECYNQTFKLNPDQAAYYIDKGYSLYHLGEKLGRIEELQIDLKNDPMNAQLYFNIANNLKELDRYHEALDFYKKSIDLDHEDIKNYLRIGVKLHEMGQNLKAIECYDKAIKLCPEYHDAYFKKGLVLHDLAKNHEAIKCFSKVTKLNNSISFIPLCYRAMLLNELGQYSEALQDLNKAYDLIVKKYSRINRKEENINLLAMLLRVQTTIIEFRKELQKCKDASINNPEMLKVFEDQDRVTKKQHLQQLERALNIDKQKYWNEIPGYEFLYREAIKEVTEFHKAIIDIIAGLPLLLSNSSNNS